MNPKDINNRPALTVGMATFEDYDGVYFTIQSLKLHHDVSDVELIVVDNSPNTEHGKHVKNLVENHSSVFHTSKYIPFEESTGTTQTRERVFRESSGFGVVCMDCHVLLVPNALHHLKQFYIDNPDSKDIITGPLLHDSATQVSTHFDLKFRSEMYGVWAHAFKCSNPTCSQMFNIRHPDGMMDPYKELIQYHDLLTGNNVGLSCPACNRELPSIPVIGHQQKLKEKNFKYVVTDYDPGIFEIPAQGLGFFSMLRKSWVGFNKHMRGFGAEEGYIHEKVRRNGGRALCHPALAWNHRFTRVHGVKYPLKRIDKVRNYVLTFNELELSLEPVHDHFVKSGLITEQQWSNLIADPIGYLSPESAHIKSLKGLALPKQNDLSMEDLYVWTCSVDRDLNKHLPTLKRLAEKVDSVVEVTKRRESTVAFVSAAPKELISYHKEVDQLVSRNLPNSILRDQIRTKIQIHEESPNGSIPETDLLFIDDQHNAEAINHQLNNWSSSVKRYIVLHDTVYHGRRGDNGKEGILVPLRNFVETNKEWFVCEHDPQQYGLTVLSRNKEDRPEQEIEMDWPRGWGVGTELKKLLSKIGIVATPNCKCNARAEEMDNRGISWCELNTALILEWLKEETENRGKSWSKTNATGAWTILKIAIRRAKKEKKRREKASLLV